MHARPEFVDLLDQAGAQAGLVTTRQAAALDVDRLQLSRLCNFGMLERVRHGVYRVTGTDATYQDISAAWASLVPGASFGARMELPSADFIASGATAARLHDIGDLWSVRYEFRTSQRRRASASDLIIRRLRVDDGDIEIKAGMPVLTPEATIADLFKAVADEDHVVNAFSDALRMDLVRRPDRLATLLEPAAKARGMVIRSGDGDGEALLERLHERAHYASTEALVHCA